MIGYLAVYLVANLFASSSSVNKEDIKFFLYNKDNHGNIESIEIFPDSLQNGSEYGISSARKTIIIIHGLYSNKNISEIKLIIDGQNLLTY